MINQKTQGWRIPFDVVEPLLAEPFAHAPHRLVDFGLERFQLLEDLLQRLV